MAKQVDHVHSIQTEFELQHAIRRIEHLMPAVTGTPEADELDHLASLVVAYEANQFKTNLKIEAALKKATSRKREPLARTVHHSARYNLLLIELSDGRRLAYPVENLQGLEHATHKQLQRYELIGGGTGISFPDLDVDFYVPALIEGVYGNRRWMKELGQRGGSATSKAKRAAAKANGAKGGRPRKPVLAA